MNKKIIACLIYYFSSIMHTLDAQQLFSHNSGQTIRSYLLKITDHLPDHQSRWYPFIVGFGQHADSAFFKDSQSKTITGSVSHLFFAQSFFAPAQSLSPSSRTSKIAPLLNACIAPRISIKKSGVAGGIQYSHALKSNIQIGLRAHLPVVKVHVKKIANGLHGKSLFGGPVITDFYKTATDIVEGTETPVNDFAIRLDFLSRLPASLVGPGTMVNFVNY
ncbi:MAG TPA: hypothetical protein VL201_05920, partial [Patescibacteria group bacterium]|nr:hypothetical protein [Patescibacteria group bacterium]